MESVIRCENLTHYYGDHLIYENLSFEVPRGRILGLLGKNGTGKTTTINILNGYLKPRSGECYIFGDNIREIQPVTRANIALLIEGHIQYGFMNIKQIERFYSAFSPKWNKEAYYELMKKLNVTEKQRISTMSCGERSQVALGLILAQNADLLILDDFSLGLDPGYRRLFIEYLREYADEEKDKTIFLTSHIIQDMEKLIDDCIILGKGEILVQMPVKELLNSFFCYTFRSDSEVTIPTHTALYNTKKKKNRVESFSFMPKEFIESFLKENRIEFSELRAEKMNLEDVFIGLTGKY